MILLARFASCHEVVQNYQCFFQEVLPRKRGFTDDGVLLGGGTVGSSAHTRVHRVTERRRRSWSGFFRARAGSPPWQALAFCCDWVLPRTRGFLPRDKNSDGNR
jgi:hypothetical protein